ncbi:MAG: periplasmic protein TonB [Bradyrhizobium sp.]|jgi:protein TonB|nr:periplasmic protein TonB [Bradyrhizobium sp.]
MSERNANPGLRAAASSSDSLQAWPGAVTHWLIQRAAHAAPPDLSERLEEEWEADLAVRTSAMARLRFAIGCCWATRVIAREYCPASIPVASTATAAKVALGFVPGESGLFTRRSLTFFLVAGLHIALFYGLMTGLAFRIIKVVPTSLQTRLVQPPQERALPPLPPPQLTKTTIEIAPPHFPPTEGPIETVDMTAEAHSIPSSWAETPPANLPHEVIRVQGGPGSGFPNTDDYYPSIAKRLEEQGGTTVRVCVGANGRLTSDPTIAQTSGSSRLDDGALMLAKAGSGHYRASTEDGRAVDSCYSFRVRFALR